MSRPDDIVRQAAALFNAGHADEARALCEAGLRQFPNQAALNHLLAAVLLSTGDAHAARAPIGASLAAAPNHAPARLLATKIARALGLTEEAAAAWRVVLTADPHHREAMARLGRLAWETGDLAQARVLLEGAVAGDCPASTWFDLGVVRQDLRDFAGAAAAYREVLARQPDDAETSVNLGTVLQEQGDLDGAMAAYSTAYRLRPATFGIIAMALTSAPHGRIWLDEAALRRSLGASIDP